MHASSVLMAGPSRSMTKTASQSMAAARGSAEQHGSTHRLERWKPLRLSSVAMTGVSVTTRRVGTPYLWMPPPPSRGLVAGRLWGLLLPAPPSAPQAACSCAVSTRGSGGGLVLPPFVGLADSAFCWQRPTTQRMYDTAITSPESVCLCVPQVSTAVCFAVLLCSLSGTNR